MKILRIITLKGDLRENNTGFFFQQTEDHVKGLSSWKS